MNRHCRRLIVLTAALFLAGCGSSPPTRYFVLTPMAGTETGRTSIETPVTVADVDMPPSLDRQEIVRDNGANTVDVSDENRWAAPIGEMARRVLTQDLAARLPPEKVLLPNSPLPQGTRSIVVSISEFGVKPNGQVVMNGSWSLAKEDGKPVSNHVIALQARSSGDVADQVAEMSRLLAQLADRIASALG